jgi:hypothetical protein
MPGRDQVSDISEDDRMPTYQVRPVFSAAGPTGETQWGLTCEQCRALVAAVRVPADLRRLSAQATLGVWPELRVPVGMHEQGCRSPGAAEAQSPGYPHGRAQEYTGISLPGRA